MNAGVMNHAPTSEEFMRAIVFVGAQFIAPRQIGNKFGRDESRPYKHA
jgi:hypothetical protein